MLFYLVFGMIPKETLPKEKNIHTLFKILQCKCIKYKEYFDNIGISSEILQSYLYSAYKNLLLFTEKETHAKYIKENFADQNIQLSEIATHPIWRKNFKKRMLFAILLANNAINNEIFFAQYEKITTHVKELAILYRINNFSAFIRSNVISFDEICIFIKAKKNSQENWKFVLNHVTNILTDDLQDTLNHLKLFRNFIPNYPNLYSKKLKTFFLLSIPHIKYIVKNNIFSPNEILERFELDSILFGKEIDLLININENSSNKPLLKFFKKSILGAPKNLLEEYYDSFIKEKKIPPELILSINIEEQISPNKRKLRAC